MGKRRDQQDIKRVIEEHKGGRLYNAHVVGHGISGWTKYADKAEVRGTASAYSATVPVAGHQISGRTRVGRIRR